MLKRRNKKAVLGGIMEMFIATIVIVAILLIFVFVSSFVKTFGDAVGTKIEHEEEVGILDLNKYFDSFKKLTEVRLLLGDGEDLGNAIQQGGYLG